MENLSETPHLPPTTLERETFLISLIGRLYEDHTTATSLIYQFKEKVRQIINGEKTLDAMLITVRFLKELNIYTPEELEMLIRPFLGKEETHEQSLNFIIQGVLQDLYNQCGGDIGHLEENIAAYNKIIEEALQTSKSAREHLQENEAIRNAVSDALQNDRKN